MNKQISLPQRYQIGALIEAKTTKKQIAKIVGFSERSIRNEICRNSKRTVKKQIYDPDFAHKLRMKRHQLKNKKIKLTGQVKRRIRWLIKCL